MIIPIDSRYRGSVLAEQEMSRFADEFFNHWPARRPASEMEVLMLSRALECSESIIERHLLLSAANPRDRRPLPPGWQCITGTRGQHNRHCPQVENLLHSSRCLRLASGREMECSAAVDPCVSGQ